MEVCEVLGWAATSKISISAGQVSNRLREQERKPSPKSPQRRQALRSLNPALLQVQVASISAYAPHISPSRNSQNLSRTKPLPTHPAVARPRLYCKHREHTTLLARLGVPASAESIGQPCHFVMASLPRRETDGNKNSKMTRSGSSIRLSSPDFTQVLLLIAAVLYNCMRYA